MANPSKILISDIVKSLLIQEGEYNDNKVMQYMDIAERGVKELTFDVAKNIKYIVLPVPNTLIVSMPTDLVKLLRIGFVTEGIFVDYGQEGSISFSPDTTQETQGILNDTINWYSNYRLGENTGGAYGHGGGHRPAYFRYNDEDHTIHLSDEFTSGDVAIEYISNGINTDLNYNNGITDIHPFLEEALRAWIWWKVIQRKRDTSPQEKELARRDWFNEKRIAKSRMQSFSKEDALRVSRKGNKQAPKF